MKIDITEDRELSISEVFSGAYLQTSEGNRVGFCMRDDTIEFNVLPKAGRSKWFRIDMQNLLVLPMEPAQTIQKPQSGSEVCSSSEDLVEQGQTK